MFCWKCGKEISDDAVFCSSCGISTKSIIGATDTASTSKEAKERHITKTKNSIKKVGRFLGRALMVFLLAMGTFSLTLAFIGVILLQCGLYLGGGVLVGNPMAVAIVTAIALILSTIGTMLFSFPEGYFSKIIGTGTSGLLLILALISLVVGLLTFVALAASIVFFIGAIIIKNKMKIETSYSLLISGTATMLFVIYLLFSMIFLNLASVLRENIFILFFGTLVIASVGLCLLSDYLRRLRTKFTKTT